MMMRNVLSFVVFFFFQAEDGIRDRTVTGVQTCALPISRLRSVPVGWDPMEAKPLKPVQRADEGASIRMTADRVLVRRPGSEGERKSKAGQIGRASCRERG